MKNFFYRPMTDGDEQKGLTHPHAGPMPNVMFATQKMEKERLRESSSSE
jgi:hypothetical protein